LPMSYSTMPLLPKKGACMCSRKIQHLGPPAPWCPVSQLSR
jgi:hypothetical protein